MSKNIEDILRILLARDLASLIGCEEGIYFDAKQEFYKLDREEGRIELAKDVSSFANSEGGIIVLGLHTERIEEKRIERVSGFNLHARSDFNSSKYLGIIDEYVYPRIEGVKVDWINNAQDKLGISYIFIPKQDKRKKYFLIKKVVDDGGLIKGIVFGISIRKDSDSDPFTMSTQNRNVLFCPN